MKQEKSRVYWLDFLGGLGIIGIVLCHSLRGTFRYTGCLGTWLSMFMIFVFFMKVGWLYEERKNRDSGKGTPGIRDLAKRRLKLRGKQYIVFSLCVFAADCVWVLLQKESPSILLRDIYRTCCLGGIGTLWFLPVITFGEILFYISKKPEKPYRYTVMGMIVLTVIYTILLNRYRRDSMVFDIITTPVSVLAKAVYGTVFMMFGGLLKRFSDKYLAALGTVQRVLVCAALIMGSFCLAYAYRGGTDFNHLEMDNTLIFFVCALLISGCVMLACEQIYLLGIRVRTLEIAGKYSLVIMVTHYSILLPLFRILIGAVLGDDALALEMPWDMAVAALVLVSQIPLSWAISKYCPGLLGKNTKPQKSNM